MSAKKCIVFILAMMMVLPCFTALTEDFSPLPMNNLSFGPKPKNENYLSNTEYQDESISVKIYEGRYADTDYVCAHVKISHPSQLRTAQKHPGYQRPDLFRFCLGRKIRKQSV